MGKRRASGALGGWRLVDDGGWPAVVEQLFRMELHNPTWALAEAQPDLLQLNLGQPSTDLLPISLLQRAASASLGGGELAGGGRAPPESDVRDLLSYGEKFNVKWDSYWGGR